MIANMKAFGFIQNKNNTSANKVKLKLTKEGHKCDMPAFSRDQRKTRLS
jgi:hypothetical protein